MKLLHMISGGDVGGAKTHVLSLLEGLNKTDEVHLVCFMEGEFTKEARQLGISVTVLNDGGFFSQRKRILGMIRDGGYELLHCHGGRANMMGMFLRKKAGIPMVTTVHSDYRLDYMGRPLAALTYGNINKIALRRFDGWIGVSDGMTQTLIQRGFSPRRIFTLYNGVDFSRELPVRSREDYLRSIGLEIGEDTIVYGIAARISPVKDMTTLVTAFSKAVRLCPNIRLVIAGEGEQSEEIHKLAEDLCPEGTVCFAGWVKDINSFYHALDVNLLTSLSETFPYALTEGARMRCATIASRVGGVPFLIDDGINGLLFTPRDVEALTEHMVFLAKHGQTRVEMGNALYEKTRREFSMEVMLEKQRSHYETILRRHCRDKNKRDGAVICGAYGMGNSGDNVILNNIVAQLKNIDPDMPIWAISRNPTETRLVARVESLYSFNLLKVCRLFRRTKLYVSGGGTLMQDATSTRSLLYYLHSIRQAARRGNRVMLYGCGVGPINKKRNRRRTARILQRYADVIAVRDQYSIDFLKQLGVTKPKIYLTADPALLTEIHGELGSLSAQGIRPDERYVMMAVRPWPGFSEKIDVFAKAAEYAWDTLGLKPVLYAMEPRRDSAAVKAVAKKLNCPHLVLEAGTDGGQVVSLIGRMELVVSMRLHALVFAAGQNVPSVGVVYDPKVSGFLDYIGQRTYLPLEKADEEELKTLIDAALAQKGQTTERIEHLCQMAKENETFARELLKEC